MTTRRNFPKTLVGLTTGIVYTLRGLREECAEYEWEFGILYVYEDDIIEEGWLEE